MKTKFILFFSLLYSLYSSEIILDNSASIDNISYSILNNSVYNSFDMQSANNLNIGDVVVFVVPLKKLNLLDALNSSILFSNKYVFLKNKSDNKCYFYFQLKGNHSVVEFKSKLLNDFCGFSIYKKLNIGKVYARVYFYINSYKLLDVNNSGIKVKSLIKGRLLKIDIYSDGHLVNRYLAK